MKLNKTFKIENRIIQYTIEASELKQSEQQNLEKFIGISYNMSQFAIEKLEKKDSKDAENFLSLIYNEVSEELKNTLIDIYFDIRKFIEKSLHIQREKIFIDDNNQENSLVLASANLDKNVINIYDSFFGKAEGDDENLNPRPTVLMHEIAHLLGLTSDAELNDINSAEAFRNFTLLICEIVSPEILFSKKENDNKNESSEDTNLDKEKLDEENDKENLKDKKEHGKNDELPFNPNHHPAGSSQGGQFASKEGGDAGTPKTEPKEKSISENGENETSEKRKPYEHMSKNMNSKMRERIEKGRYYTYDEAKDLIGDVLDTMENDELAVVMSRIKYLSKSEPIPSKDNSIEQAKYYAKHYYAGNTAEKRLNRQNKFVNTNKKFKDKSE